MHMPATAMHAIGMNQDNLKKKINSRRLSLSIEEKKTCVSIFTIIIIISSVRSTKDVREQQRIHTYILLAFSAY